MSNQLVLLCEDANSERFAIRFLTGRYGYGTRDMRIERHPRGQGSGEQGVRNRFAHELSALRQRRARSNLAALIVITDADTGTVEARIASLDKALTFTDPETKKQRTIPPRTPDDPVVMVIPKRNIETWLTYLEGEAIDEQKDYKKGQGVEVPNESIKKMVEMCKNQKLRQPAPPSLQAACEELEKLPRRQN